MVNRQKLSLTLRNLSYPRVEDLRWPQMPQPFNPGWPGPQACVWTGCQVAEWGTEWSITCLWLWVMAQGGGKTVLASVSENRAKCGSGINKVQHRTRKVECAGWEGWGWRDSLMYFRETCHLPIGAKVIAENNRKLVFWIRRTLFF